MLLHDQFGKKKVKVKEKEGKRKEELQNSSILCLWGEKKATGIRVQSGNENKQVNERECVFVPSSLQKIIIM